MNPNRRRLLALPLLLLARWGRAGGVDAATDKEAAQAVREILEASVRNATTRLGRIDGFYANADIRIGLPRNFRKADRVLRGLGQGRKVDDLILAMNRTAEAAMPKAQALALDALSKLHPEDAKALLSTGEDGATRWFSVNTEAALNGKLLPVIHELGAKSGLPRAYSALANTLMSLAGIKSELVTVENYVSERALAGIYALTAEEERAIRANPGAHALSTMSGAFGQIRRDL